MLSPQPDKRQLAVILNDPTLLQHIVNSRLQGEIEAFNRVDSRLPPTDRGTQAHRETLIKLCDYLQPMDFVHEIVENQVRLISPPDTKGNRFRLLTCRGVASGMHVTINRKGYQTQILVEQENPLHFPHLPLYDIEEFPPLNIWCIASVDSDADGLEQVSIHLAIPHELHNDHTEFECMECELIYRGELTTAPVLPIDQPASVDIDIDFGDKDGTND